MAKHPDGFKLELWGEKAQAFVDSGAKKGDLVDVTGRVKSETWNDRTTGEQRTGLVVLVEEWSLAGQPRPPAAAPAPAAAAKLTPPPVWTSSAADGIDDSDVPF
jgi:single-stranded DNA-binding protein